MGGLEKLDCVVRVGAGFAVDFDEDEFAACADGEGG